MQRSINDWSENSRDYQKRLEGRTIHKVVLKISASKQQARSQQEINIADYGRVVKRCIVPWYHRH